MQNKSMIKILKITRNLLDPQMGCVKHEQIEYISKRANINKTPFKSEVLEYMKRADLCCVVSTLPCPAPDYDRRDYYPGSIAYFMDNEYSWNSLDIYFLEKYNMELPEDFIKHVLSKCKL